GALIRIAKNIDSKYFYSHINQLICDSILRLYNEGRKVDLLTVTNDLKNKGKLDFVGGAYYLTELTDKVVSSLHIEEHLQILQDAYMLREQILIYTEKVNECYDFKSPLDISLDVSNKLMLLQSNSDLDNEHTIEQLSINSIRKREHKGEDKDITGISTGIKSLDKVILGLNETDVTVIAGRPAMGKTAVAISIAK